MTNVYILSTDDCQAIFSINATHPQGPHIIVCNHGSGPCVEETDIDDPMYSDWKAALEALVPFASRSMVTVVTIDSDE